MAKKPKVKMNSRGAIALLRGASVRTDIEKRVTAIAAAAGPGFVPKVIFGRTRILGSVHAETDGAREAAADHALERALVAGR